MWRRESIDQQSHGVDGGDSGSGSPKKTNDSASLYDSRYLHDGITKFIHGWKRNDWRTADKKKVKNIDLWLRIEAAAKPHNVSWFWVKGHAGHVENERADALARKGLEEGRAITPNKSPASS